MRREKPEQLLGWLEELRQSATARQACAALLVPPVWYYRRRAAPPAAQPIAVAPRPQPAHALSTAERSQVRLTLNSVRFMDQTPRSVYAALLDEGQYLCHWRTMYRVLDEHSEVRERRRLRRLEQPARPQLAARAVNEVWSWDITRLPGPHRGLFFYLYVMLDLFSRFVVGWMLARQENKSLGRHFVAATCRQWAVAAEQLTVHSDRGNPMRAGEMADLLATLQVAQSFARPRTPDDNPYSEAHFKTLKYRPDYPGRFADLAQAHAWAQGFFAWYNHEHYHVALGLMTPAMVYHGQAAAVQAQRQAVLDAAYAAHPNRFGGGRPQAGGPPDMVWINPPPAEETAFSDRAAPLIQSGALSGSRAAERDSRLPGPLNAGKHLAILPGVRGQIASVDATPFEDNDLFQNA